MASRTDPNMTDKLCAMILLHFQIPHEVGKTLTREQILGLVQWDHAPVPVAIARDLRWEPAQYNHPSNLAPLLVEDHAVKTAKIDVPQIAKSERISASALEFQQRILAKSGQIRGQADDAVSHNPARRSKSHWPKGRRLPSRPFPKTVKSPKKENPT